MLTIALSVLFGISAFAACVTITIELANAVTKGRAILAEMKQLDSIANRSTVIPFNRAALSRQTRRARAAVAVDRVPHQLFAA